MSETDLDIEQKLDHLKLMASGIGVTMTPMPIQMIYCSTELNKLLQKRPDLVSEVIRFSIENCGEQYYARWTMAKSLIGLGGGKHLSKDDLSYIELWKTHESEEMILKDLDQI